MNLNLVVLRIHVLHKLKLEVMYMYGGPLKHVQHLQLYGSVSRLYSPSVFIGDCYIEHTLIETFIVNT